MCDKFTLFITLRCKNSNICQIQENILGYLLNRIVSQINYICSWPIRGMSSIFQSRGQRGGISILLPPQGRTDKRGRREGRKPYNISSMTRVGSALSDLFSSGAELCNYNFVRGICPLCPTLGRPLFSILESLLNIQ